MLLIWGFKSYVRQLAIVTFVCQNCHTPAAQRVVERIRKFTLFFIPLFPVSHKRFVTCTFCGQASEISADQAAQYVAHAAQPAQWIAPATPTPGSLPGQHPTATQ